MPVTMTASVDATGGLFRLAFAGLEGDVALNVGGQPITVRVGGRALELNNVGLIQAGTTYVVAFVTPVYAREEVTYSVGANAFTGPLPSSVYLSPAVANGPVDNQSTLGAVANNAVEFSYVPVFADAGVDVRFAYMTGVGTIQDSQYTDRGRLYGKIVTVSPDFIDFRVSLHRDYTRSAATERIVGDVTAADVADGAWADLGPAGAFASGMAARVKVGALPGYAPGVAKTWQFLAIVSFATDVDVSPDVSQVAAFPGYDATLGLAAFHAAAMREILTTALPSRIPHLFGDLGLAGLVPMEESEVTIPDLRKLASVDTLRIAQADLVKALSAEQREHQEEWREIAAAARARFNEKMDAVGLANAPAEETASEGDLTNPPLSFGRFARG